MKVDLRCTRKMEVLNQQTGVAIYRVEFGTFVKDKENLPSHVADLAIESPKKMHYKVGDAYEINIGEPSNLVTLPGGAKIDESKLRGGSA